MNLLVMGDIHAQVQAIDEIRGMILDLSGAYQPDLILATGDFTNTPPEPYPCRHDPRAVIQRVELALGAFGIPVLCVGGNHDRPDLWGVSGCLQSIDILAGQQPLITSGVRFIGVGGSWRLVGFPYEWDDEEVRCAVRNLDGPADVPEIVLSHVPPALTALGRTFNGELTGSLALRELIEARRPLLHVFGHIHEAAGWERWGRTTLLNAGAVSGLAPMSSVAGGDLNPNLGYVSSRARFAILSVEPENGHVEGHNFTLGDDSWVVAPLQLEDRALKRVEEG